MKMRVLIAILGTFYFTSLAGEWSEPQLIGTLMSPVLTVDNEGWCWCGVGYMYKYYPVTSKWELEAIAPIYGFPCFDKGNSLWLLATKGTFFYYSRYNGEEWSAVDTVQLYPSWNGLAELTADSSGGVWVFWSTDWWYGWPVAYTRYHEGQWDELKTLTDTLEKGVDHALYTATTDALGRVWVGWVNYPPDPKVKPLKATYWDGDKWCEEMTVFLEEGMIPNDFGLTPDHNGGVWAIWSLTKNTLERTPTLIQVSRWDGFAWSVVDTVTIISGGFIDISEPPDGKLAVDAYGRAWAVWRQALVDVDSCGDIYYSVNSGSGWSEPKPVNVHPAADSDPDIAIDGDGRVWCVWESNRFSQWAVWASYTMSTGVEEQPETQAITFDVQSFTANPRVTYSLPAGQSGTLAIYDALGRKVESLRVQGSGEVRFSPSTSGVYFVRLESWGFEVTKKTVVLR